MHRNTFNILATTLMVSLFSAIAQGQSTWYVDDDAPLGGDGTSWDTAYKYLQDALAVAAVGDEIHVAGGLYKPDLDEAGIVTPGERDETFQLISGVGLYSGYAGLANPGDPDERDIAMYETLLSGDLEGDDGPDFANSDENCYHVVTGSGTDATAILDGFTIIGGNAYWDSMWEVEGGGMENVDGSPTLLNCVFIGNQAVIGGGMWNDNSSPTLINCVFTGNWALGGGGMENSNSAPSLVTCTFTSNVASEGYAGGMENSGGSMPTLTNCIVYGNTAFAHAQIYSDPPDLVTVTYSDIQDGWLGEGNIDADPCFTDPDGPDDIYGTEDDNLRLLFGSPCIDAADNTAVPADIADLDGDEDTSERTPYDIDGSPRFVDDPHTDDTGVPDPPDYEPVVDMGAYEFQADQPIPTVSEWGVIAMTLLVLTAGTLVFMRRHAVRA